MIFVAVYFPLALLLAGGGCWAAWYMQHDTGQRAAGRGGLITPATGAHRPHVTPWQPPLPAELAGIPSTQPPSRPWIAPAPFVAAEAPTIAHPAIPAGRP